MSAQLRKRGFTLVEILIVVVILGILAAIVIPQFTNASESAKASSLISQLQTIRSQIELYQVQHTGDYPATTTLPTGATTFWDQMTETSDSDGTVHTDGTGDFGPYLQKAPVNPFTNDSVVATDNSESWKYDEDTGKILAVIPANKWDQLYELGLGTEADEGEADNADVVKGPSS